MIKSSKIKGGSVLFATVISLLIFIICSSFILYFYLSSQLVEDFIIDDKLNRNLNSAFLIAVSDNQESDIESSIDLFGVGNDSVIIRKKDWGALQVIYCEAFFNNKKRIRSAMIGSALDTTNNTVLLVADNTRPLSISGSTKLIGDIFISERGIKKNSIEGENSTSAIHQGSIKQSPSSIQETNPNLFKALNKLRDENNTNDEFILIEKNLADSLINKFDKPTKRYYSKNKIIIDHVVANGNIIIQSSSEIIVTSTSTLNDIILIAPIIRFKKEFKGSLQAFATDSLLVDEACVFNYCSVLCIQKVASAIQNPTLKIGEKCKIFGAVLGLDEDYIFDKPLKISIAPKSLVYGQIYCMGIANMRSDVYGIIETNRLVLETPSSVYDNQLLNVEINRSKLSKHFVTALLSKEITKKSVVKWLN